MPPTVVAETKHQSALAIAAIAAQMASAEFTRTGVPPWKSPGWEKVFVERAAGLVRMALESK